MKEIRRTSTSLKISRDYFVFSAAHFAIFPDGRSESLHGHNYQVCIEIKGGVLDDQYIIQFHDIKVVTRQIVNSLNHKTIIPDLCKKITIKKAHDSVHIKNEAGKIYLLPLSDVIFLPIKNTTVEALSEYFVKALVELLPDTVIDGLESVNVSIEESVGQGASTLLEF